MANRLSGRTVAILVILFFEATVQASAYPVARVQEIAKPADAFPSLSAFGRGRGGLFQRRQPRHAATPARSFLMGRASRAKSVHPVQPSKAHFSWPRRPGRGRQSTSNEPPSASRLPPPRPVSGRNDPPPLRNPGGFDIWGPLRPRVPPPAAALIPPTAAAIAGFGGTRPPIAPHFARNQGQPPSIVVAALLNTKRHRAKEILIEVPSSSANQLRQALSDQYGVEIRELGTIELINARIWRLTLVRGQDLGAVLGQLLQDNRIISAQPNYVYTPLEGPDDSSPEGKRKTASAAPAAQEPPTGAGVKVAIIDTCVDRDHTEIQGSVQSFFDATASQSKGCAAENHGTAVASLIGGHDQIQGSASGTSLMEARAFTVTEEEKEVAATSQEITLALNWAVKEGARVANLSFAGPSDPLVERAVAAAYTRGIVLVAAAGNAGPSSQPLFPAAYPEVIAVTATNAKQELYAAANRGSHVAVSARGVDVLVAHVNNGYGTESGTSFAAATVSGIAAGLVEMRPKAKPDEIRAALQNTAVSSAKGRNELFGYGLVDAKAAAAFVKTKVSH